MTNFHMHASVMGHVSSFLCFAQVALGNIRRVVFAPRPPKPSLGRMEYYNSMNPACKLPSRRDAQVAWQLFICSSSCSSGSRHTQRAEQLGDGVIECRSRRELPREGRNSASIASFHSCTQWTYSTCQTRKHRSGRIGHATTNYNLLFNRLSVQKVQAPCINIE